MERYNGANGWRNVRNNKKVQEKKGIHERGERRETREEDVKITMFFVTEFNDK